MLGWLTLWAWVNSAVAATVGLTGVHDAGLGLDEQAALAAAMVAAIESSGVHDVLTPVEVAARYAGREDLVLQEGLLAEGRRALEDGRLLYQQAQPEDATAALEGAVRVLEDGVRWTRSVRDLWEADMLLATARHATGDMAGARDAIGQALAVHAQRRPDPAQFPPAILALYENERQISSGETAGISIDVSAPGAQIWLDGRLIGTAPMVAPEVFPGLHHVHARAGGLVGFMRVEVPAGVSRAVRVELETPVLGSPARTPVGRSAQTAALYEALGRYTSVDALVLAGRIDGVLQVQVYTPESDAFGPPVVLDALADDARLVEAVRQAVGHLRATGDLPPSPTVHAAISLDVTANRLLARDLLAPVTPVAPKAPDPDRPGPPKGPDEPVARKPKWPVWLGVGLGVAAAAAGGTALALVLTGDEPPVGTATTGTLIIGRRAP